jgi:hypothetical protein
VKTIFIIIFVFIVYNAFPQIIPDNRTVDWTTAVLNFQFKEPSILLNIVDFGGDGNGLTDNSVAFQQTLQAANGQPAIIYFPAGEFVFNESIVLDDNIVLKGEGADKTTLLFEFSQQNIHGIVISGSYDGGEVRLDSGYVFNSRKLVCDSAFLFNPGQTIEIREENDNWDIKPAQWAKRVVGQITIVDSVVDNVIFIHSPLRIDYKDYLNPVIRAISPMVNAGISCLKIKRIDQPVTGGGYNIYVSKARNCRITGIESDTSVASHIYISQSLNVRVTGSYFHNAFKYDGASTHGYGVTLAHRTSECVIENNIFEHLRHAMMVKTGANGNIFAYNYSTDVYRSEYPHDYGGDISLHGHYPYANLFEGNIVQNIIIDHYWGPSGALNTFFRNRAELWGIVFTSNSQMETNEQNIVGNEITDNNFLYGRYSLSGEDHFEYANNVKGNIVPASTDSLTDETFYLTEEPVFWNIDNLWPSLGVPNEPGAETIPAKARFLSDYNNTVCFDSVMTLFGFVNISELKIWPNPSNGEFYVDTSEMGKKLIVEIYSLSGKKIFSDTLTTGFDNNVKISAQSVLKNGVYIIKILSGNKIRINKFYVY